VIVGSGLTVAGAMACLSFCRLPYFESLGAPCSAGLLVVLAASLTLAAAILVVAPIRGARPQTRPKGAEWRRIGTAVASGPGQVLIATILIAMVGSLALPAYAANYNDRDHIPGYTQANIGFHASDRHFSASPRGARTADDRGRSRSAQPGRPTVPPRLIVRVPSCRSGKNTKSPARDA
jgi:RND superfamily putative drug exporter